MLHAAVMDFVVMQASDSNNEAGGGAYIRALMSGLREAGHTCRVENSLVWPPNSVAIVDGLGIARFTPEQLAGAVGLIHHPAALASDDLKHSIRQAEQRLMPLLRRVVATSRIVADRLAQDYGVPADHIAVVPPGVPTVPRGLGSGSPTCYLLSLGACVPRKGHAVLITALARLFDLDWRLTIVGDTTRNPEHAASLRDLAEQSAPGRVQFSGALPPAALEAEWRRADVFALATEWEGHSAPVAEAIRRGLPVAVTSGGAAAADAKPEFSVVCPPGDSVGLSKAIRRLIFDTELRAEMSKAAWQAGQALPDWPTQVQRFVEAVA